MHSASRTGSEPTFALIPRIPLLEVLVAVLGHVLRRAARHLDPGEHFLAPAAAQQRVDRHAQDLPGEIVERQINPGGRETGGAPGGIPTHQINQHLPVQGVLADQFGRHVAVDHRPDDLDRLGLVARRLADAGDPFVGVNLDDDIRQHHEAVGVARPHDLQNPPLVVARGRIMPGDFVHAVPESSHRDADRDGFDGGDFHDTLQSEYQAQAPVYGIQIRRRKGPDVVENTDGVEGEEHRFEGGREA